MKMGDNEKFWQRTAKSYAPFIESAAAGSGVIQGLFQVDSRKV